MCKDEGNFLRKEVLNLTLSALFVAFMAAAGTVLKIPLPPPFPALSMQFFYPARRNHPRFKVRRVIHGYIHSLRAFGLPIFSAGGGVGYVFLPFVWIYFRFYRKRFSCRFFLRVCRKQNWEGLFLLAASRLFLGNGLWLLCQQTQFGAR